MPKPDAPPIRKTTFEDVLNQEIADIAERRQKVEPPLPKNQKADVPGTVVGLALSGGGIRSASFNLGLLQSFFRYGLLRHLDYLSTVSGGGYLGSYLSALIHASARPVGQHNPRLSGELVPGPTGKQPARVTHFARHGKYLYHPLSFLNRYLIGLLLNSLAFLSMLIFLCAFAAWAWRCLDMSPLADTLYASTSFLGFWSIQEWNRPLLPAAVLGVGWLIAWAIAYARHPMRPLARGPRYWLWAVAGALFVGLAVFLGTPAIDLGGPTIPDQPTNDLLIQTTYFQSQSWISSSVFGVVFIGLLPFLQPRDLLERGIRPSTWYDPWIFRFACSALLLGIPFLLILCFARHDFSMSGTEKRSDFSDTDIQFRRWNVFWKKVKAEWAAELASSTPSTNSKALLFWPSRYSFASPGGIIWESMREAGIDATLFDTLQNDSLDSTAVPLDPTARAFRFKVTARLNEYVIHGVVLSKRARIFQDRGWIERESQHHREKDRLLRLLDKAQLNLLDEGTPESDPEAWELNRLLLEIYYPEDVWPRSIIRRYTLVVKKQEATKQEGGTPKTTTSDDLAKAPRLIDLDQQARLTWALGALAVFVVAGLLVNLNGTSLHGYYRDQLAHTFLRGADGGEGIPRLADLATAEKGGPYHLINVTLNRLPNLGEVLLGKRGDGDARTAGPYLFSRRAVGSEETGYLDTKLYLQGSLQLDDAMAVSGAAFTPIHTGNTLIVFLMTLLNLRLGQWYPHPYRTPLWPAPTALPLFLELLGKPEGRRWCFLTDGAHHENLGLDALLDRRCRLIVVSDVSEDAEYHFDDLLSIMARARGDDGVRISSIDGEGDQPLPLDPLRPEKGTGPIPLSKAHYLVARIDYPDSTTGHLIYLKPTLTGDESSVLLGFRAEHGDFPHEPSMDQLFDEDQFEAYRQLGEHIGEQLCLEFLFVQTTNPTAAMWDPAFDLHEGLEKWLRRQKSARNDEPR